MAYATYEDVAARTSRIFSERDEGICETLLEDAAVIIDACNSTADENAKLVVSCRMVLRAMGDGSMDIPIGATQGSASALGYSQSWTINNGSVGELYLSRTEKGILKAGNKVGSHSPIEDLTKERT